MKNLIIIGLVFSVLLFAGCTGPLPPPIEKTGKLMLSITDKKVDGLESLYVTISSVELHMAAQEQEQNENYGWILFSEEEKTFDIMSLDSTQGLKDLLGEKTLETGKYTQIRFEVKEVKAVINGEEFDVEVPSDKLKIVSNFEVIAGKETEMIIDFSPESVIKSGNTYKLKPVLKLLTAKEFKERNQNQNQNKEKYCEENADCACGVKTGTQDCFFGNKEFVNTETQCPDFCTGIAGNLTIECKNNKCVQQTKAMTQEQARELAEKEDSECMQNGTLKEQANYNENSNTWWIDLEATEPQEGCNPACVINKNGQIEVNWRCTGLIEEPAVDDTEFLEQTCDATETCAEGYDCASFPGIGLKCYPITTEDPCAFVDCPSNKECIIAESYPVQIICSPKSNSNGNGNN